MSALQARTYAVDDRVAYADREAGEWRRGTVSGLVRAAVTGRINLVGIRFDGDARIGFYDPDSRRLVPEAEVPLDERHWLPQKVRDQLARQEAAGRLRAFAHALLPLDGVGWARLGELADDLDSVLLGDDDDGVPDLVRAARALLAPAPADEPAPTP